MKLSHLILPAFVLVLGNNVLADEADIKKGLYERVEIKSPNLQGTLETVYEAHSDSLFSTWESDDFKIVNDKYSTGEYASDANLQTVSPSISLPTVSKEERLYLCVNENYHTEYGCDFVKVSVSEDGGESFKVCCIRSGVSDDYKEYIDVTSFAGKNIKVKLSLTSDSTNTGSGWNVSSVAVKKHSNVKKSLLRTMRAPEPQGLPNVKVTPKIKEITCTGITQEGWPETLCIYFSARDSMGNFIDGLNKKSLTVEINGVPIDIACIEMERLDSTWNIPVQVAFLLDCSDSMEPYIEGIKDNIRDLVEKLSLYMRSYAGIYIFGNGPRGYCLKKSINLYNNHFLSPIKRIDGLTTFQGYLENVTIGGSYEPYYSCLYDMTENSMLSEFVGGNAQKVIVLVGDEGAFISKGADNSIDCSRFDDYGNEKVYTLETKKDLIAKLKEKGYQVFTIVDESLLLNGVHDASFDGIAQSTGGVSIDIQNNTSYDKIFDRIGSTLTERYIMTINFDSCKIPIDSCLDVRFVIDDSTITESHYCPHTMCSVKRTASTVRYDSVAVDSFSTKERVGVWIECPEGNNQEVESVNVYFREHGSRIFSDTVVTDFSIDGYYANVPSRLLKSNAVVDYWFDVNMKDGSYILLSPAGVTPDYWTITVRPNEPPHYGKDVKIDVSPICKNVTVTAKVADDGGVKKASLWYRKFNSINEFDEIPGEKVSADPNDSTYTFSLPEGVAVAPGFEYYFFAEDSLGATTYKGTSEQPLLKNITDTVVEEETGKIQTISFQPSNSACSSFLKDDSLFVYYKNICEGEVVRSLAGSMVVARDRNRISKFQVLQNTREDNYRNGLRSGDTMVVILRRGGTLYDVTPIDDAFYQWNRTFFLNLPSQSSFEVVANWRLITNGQTSLSTLDNTDFGFTNENGKTYEYSIRNNSGCGEVNISTIGIDNAHFEASPISLNIPDHSTGNFAITFDGKDKVEDAVVTIKGMNMADYTFHIAGDTASMKGSCDGVTLSNPINWTQNHALRVTTTIPNGWLHIYAADMNGNYLASLYNGTIHAGSHELEFYNIYGAVYDKPKFILVIEREGEVPCSSIVGTEKQ